MASFRLNLMAMTLQNLAMAPAQAAQAAKGGAEQAIKVYAEEDLGLETGHFMLFPALSGRF